MTRPVFHSTQLVGIVMNGVTGRMGYRQHLLRSILAIREQGGLALPGPFLRFIGVAEVCGALGLVLPWALSIQPRLTPLAAGGLVIIMIGATVVTVLTGPIAGALVPFTVGSLALLVACQRTRCTV